MGKKVPKRKQYENQTDNTQNIKSIIIATNVLKDLGFDKKYKIIFFISIDIG